MSTAKDAPSVNEGTDLRSAALATLTEAQRMLSEAQTLGDFRGLRDFSTAARAWAKARKLGVEAENEVAEFVLRAERGIGKELLRMVTTGQRLRRGYFPKGVAHDKRGRVPEGPGAKGQGVTLRDLGISGQDASYWQALASVPDDTFEAAIADALTVKADGYVRRLSKASFYRLAGLTKGRSSTSVYHGPDDPVTPFENLRAATEGLLMGHGLSRLSPGDLTAAGQIGVRLVKAVRAEMDRRHK